MENLDMKNLSFSSPCGIRGDLLQLESRIENGLNPLIIMRKKLDESIEEKLIKFISENANFEFSFDLGPFSLGKINDYIILFEAINKLRDSNFNISSDVGIKLGALMGEFDDSHISRYPIEEFTSFKERELDELFELNETLQSLGLNFSIENKPFTNYSFSKDLVTPDPYPRWLGQWSGRALFCAATFAYSKQIVDYLSKLSRAKVHLDVEHLSQIAQWGNIFNLENEKSLNLNDLSKEQKNVLACYDLPLDESGILFDYDNLTDLENEFLEENGFIFRKGSPLVFKKKLTLVDELKKLQDSDVLVSGITPGFQAYHAFLDRLDNQNQIVIASHLPGVTDKYFKNPFLRQNWTEMVRAVHYQVFDFMKAKEVRDVEFEIQVDDGEKIVYGGPVWNKDIKTARDQFKANLSDYSSGVPIKQEPYYLR